MDNVLKIIGLAFRAKKVVLGEEVLNRISKVSLLFLAADISDKSKERYLKKCFFYKIDYIDSYDSLVLSKAIGKNNIKILGIIDKGFAQSIRKNIVKEEKDG